MKLYVIPSSWKNSSIIVLAEDKEQAEQLILDEDSWADTDKIQEYKLIPGLVIAIPEK